MSLSEYSEQIDKQGQIFHVEDGVVSSVRSIGFDPALGEACAQTAGIIR